MIGAKRHPSLTNARHPSRSPTDRTTHRADAELAMVNQDAGIMPVVAAVAVSAVVTLATAAGARANKVLIGFTPQSSSTPTLAR
jgi:hypothetical protein